MADFTTLALGEEDTVTSQAIGEEDPYTTLALGEEDTVTSQAIGEEDPYTTLALGEEDGGGKASVSSNPFGAF